MNYKSNSRKRKSLSASVGVCLSLVCLLFFAFPFQIKAQVRPVYDQGALGLGQLLKRLNTTASVMMIGAHPDDEDTALLAYLARGESARTAYLSLTRGDGGQNIIGPELGESLGIIRTEELLQARRLDGAEQYFTRAYDYGFSKTLDEAKQKWDEKIILCDVVRAIRLFRPLVVVSQFSGTPADGHGQHQFAGYISPLAVKAAANPAECQEAGPAWEVKKFYLRHRGSGEPTLRINTGKYDPLLGRSYFEIAMEARSQHKSQEQGVLELKGDQFSSLNLVNAGVPTGKKEVGVFDGLDISTNKLGPKIVDGAAKALREFDPLEPQKILPFLSEAYFENLHVLLSLQQGFLNRGGIRYILNADEKPRFELLEIAVQKKREFQDAIALAAGIRIDALSDKETIVPGEAFQVTVRVFYPPLESVKVINILINGLPSKKIDEPDSGGQAPFRREIASSAAYLSMTVPKLIETTQPFWLNAPRNGNLYQWPPAYYVPNSSFQELRVSAEVILEISGKRVHMIRPVEYRFADDTRGEVRRELNVVPAVSVSLDQDFLIVSAGSKPRTRRIVMRVENNASAGSKGSARLILPANSKWKITPESQPFELKMKGEKAAMVFDVTIPPNTATGSYVISGETIVGESKFTSEMNTIAYPHIQTHRFYTKAETRVLVMDLKTAPVKIGYIAGSGDKVPDTIEQMGLNAAMLSEADLSSGDLAKYDVIVVGIRASEVRPDFAANNQRLLDFVKNGGTLIVQYQRPAYAQQGLAPFPAQMGPRVANENAKVTILQPNHTVFNFPNKITDKDFEGWVQERNLYNFSTFDEKYTPLLESHDAGEPENKGGLVIADIGKGKYIYCSYSMFRQLPAGVPGAYRLFANLLSLPKARK